VWPALASRDIHFQRVDALAADPQRGCSSGGREKQECIEAGMAGNVIGPAPKSFYRQSGSSANWVVCSGRAR